MTNTEEDDLDLDLEPPFREAGCRFPKIDQKTKGNEPHRESPSLEICDLGNKKMKPHNERNDLAISRSRNSEAGIKY